MDGASSTSVNAEHAQAGSGSPSRWHWTLYPLRIAFSVLGTSLLISMWADGLPFRRAVGCAVVLLLWPHLWLLVGRRWFSRRSGAFFLNAADGLLLVLIPATHWGMPLANLGITAITINAIVTGGPQLFRRAAIFGSGGLLAGLVLFGLPELHTYSARTWVFSALAVASDGVLAAMVAFRAANALEKTKTQLAELNRQLEDKVTERTKELAQTNAAISRFVPTEFLNALGHSDVTKAKLGDAVQRRVTILFADIRNFSTISEHFSPGETGVALKLTSSNAADAGFRGFEGEGHRRSPAIG